MQSGDVAVSDGLLPPGVLADALYGQVHFDEALGVGGHNGSWTVSTCEPTCSLRPNNMKL